MIIVVIIIFKKTFQSKCKKSKKYKYQYFTSTS